MDDGIAAALQRNDTVPPVSSICSWRLVTATLIPVSTSYSVHTVNEWQKGLWIGVGKEGAVYCKLVVKGSPQNENSVIN